MAVTIEKDFVNFTMTCHESPDARCRMRCAGNCEDACVCDNQVSGECLAAEWINEESSAAESYTGKPAPLHHLMAVDVEWNGDYWTWETSPA